MNFESVCGGAMKHRAEWVSAFYFVESRKQHYSFTTSSDNIFLDILNSSMSPSKKMSFVLRVVSFYVVEACGVV